MGLIGRCLGCEFSFLLVEDGLLRRLKRVLSGTEGGLRLGFSFTRNVKFIGQGAGIRQSLDHTAQVLDFLFQTFLAPAVGIGIGFQRLNFGTLLRKGFAFGIGIGLCLFERLFGIGQHALGLSLFFLIRRVILDRQGGEGLTGVGEGALGFFFLALLALNVFSETRGFALETGEHISRVLALGFDFGEVRCGPGRAYLMRPLRPYAAARCRRWPRGA